MPNINESTYTRHMQMEVRARDGDTRQVELSFSSEQPYDRWFGTEILSHDEGAVNLDRLKDVGSLLFHHGRDPNLGSIPVGRIIEVDRDDGGKRAKAVVAFDSDEKSDLIYQKVKSGAIRGVSVGYRIDAYEEVKAGKTSANGRFTGPCVVATKWSPYEISIEPTPADDSVGIGRSQHEQEKGAIIMGEENTTKTAEQTAEKSVESTPAPAPAAQPDPAQIRAEAIQAERTRSAEITAMCRDFGLDPTGYITGEKGVDEVRKEILEQIKAGQKGQPPIPAANLEVTADEEDKYRSAARDGQLLRMGISVEKPAAGASDFRGMTLRNLAAACLMRTEGSGLDVMRMGDEDLLKSALGYTRAGLEPDSAFVSIINNTVGSVLSKGYQTANTTFQLWTGRGSNPNFKAAKRFRLSAAGEMVEVKQNGEFKADTVTDEGVDTQLKTYGKKFGFTRQAFINDDLGTLAKAVMAQARSGKRTINKQVYKLIGENQKYVDGTALFHASHGNLGAAAALSKDSLGDLYIKMTLQKDMSGKEQLNISPKFGLFPAAIQMDVRQLLHSLSDPEANHSGVINPVQGLVTPIFEAELDQYGNKAFYIVADAMDVDTVEVGYLNGKEEPTLESRVEWDTLGIGYRMYHDWYVALLDFRGLAMNPGK